MGAYTEQVYNPTSSIEHTGKDILHNNNIFLFEGKKGSFYAHQVDSKGSTVIAGFEDGVVRVFTISKPLEENRKRNKSECEVVLKQAFKPHSQAITAMAYDGKGQSLATGVSIY